MKTYELLSTEIQNLVVSCYLANIDCISQIEWLSCILIRVTSDRNTFAAKPSQLLEHLVCETVV